LHDVESFIDDLGAKLTPRSRHVCTFLGAGASAACGLPSVADLEKKVTRDLRTKRLALRKQMKGRNLEQALSRVRRIASLLEGGAGEVDGLNAKAASALDDAICRSVVKHLAIDGADLVPVLRFAQWAAHADYDTPLELFTVNYDLLLETALERLAVPYFDGFAGALAARFRTDLVEASPDDPRVWLPPFVARLWKLHGSVNWEWEDGGKEITRQGQAVSSGRPAAIYPSDTKYDESRRVPFVVLQDRFRRSLDTPETLVLISGYSWADEHLNDMFFDAAKRRPRTELVACSYGSLPDVLAERAQELPNIQAITDGEAVIGGIRGRWEPPADDIPDVWEGGKCLLGDFRHLSEILARSSPRHGDTGRRVAEFLEGLTAGA
jgi:SIR2-like domain